MINAIKFAIEEIEASDQYFDHTREKTAAGTRAETVKFTSRILEGLMARRGLVEPREGSWFFE